jgi:hypothetical protein
MKKTCTQLAILVMVAFIVLPVCVNGQNITNSTVTPTTTKTVLEPLVTTQVPAETTTTIPVTNTTLVLSTNTTPPPGTTTEMISVTTAITPVPTESLVTQISTGNVTVASSPLGASILIDGVYYGTTLGNLTGIPAGNHMVRLTLSGYYDYEGTIYIVPGQVTHVFGTLPPLSGTVSQLITSVPVITTVPSATVQPTQTPSGGAFESPAVIAAVIGIITACIGAGATIFTHMSKMKKE